MRLVRWQGEDLLRRLDDVIAVYGAAMGYEPALLEVRRGYIAMHVHRHGFRAVATFDGDDGWVGFGYGYLSESGQWWHDQVCAGLRSADRRAWRLHVTAQAQPLVVKLRAVADEMIADAFAGIDPKEIKITRAVVGRVRENATGAAPMHRASNQ